MLGIWSDYILPCLCAFLACVGFTLVFNIHGVGKLICGVGGALGWLIYLLGGSSILAAFWASAAIGLFSEIMARLRRYCVAGDTQRFLDTLLHTFGMASALAVGAMMTASLFRAAYPHLHRSRPAR